MSNENAPAGDSGAQPEPSAAPLPGGAGAASNDMGSRLDANAPPSTGGAATAPEADEDPRPCKERGKVLAAISGAVTRFGNVFKKRNYAARFTALIGACIGAFDWFTTPFRSHLLYCRGERPIRWLIGSPLLTAQIALYLAIAWGVVGSELGLTDLFWNESWWSQFWVGVGTAWLFGTVLFVNVLLHGFAPDHLPDAPTETDWCRWRVYTTSLFPSLNPGVRHVGQWMLGGLVLLLLVLYAGKALAIEWGKAPSVEVGKMVSGGAPAAPKSDAGGLGWNLFPHYGIWFVVGYLSSFVTVYLVSLFDAAVELREKVALTEWLTSPGEVKPCAGDLPPAARPTPHQQHTLRLLHAMAITLGFSILTVLGALLLWIVVVYEVEPNIDPRWGQISPAVLLSLFLMLLDVVGGLTAFRVRGARTLGVALLALIAFLNINSIAPNKMTFPDIANEKYDVDKRLPLGNNEYLEPETNEKGEVIRPAYRTQKPPGGLVGSKEFLEQFNKKKDKPRLVVVAVSGGGVRAAVWTGVVLEGLEAELDGSAGKPNIRNNIRIIAGASGGMVGAAGYVGNFDAGPLPQTNRDPETGLLPFSERLAENSLTPVVQTMVLRDFTWSILPGRYTEDRGRTLEWAWDANFEKPLRGETWAGGSPFRKTFATLRAGDRGANRPALIFTPLMVEDSKRLFVSNLDLDALAVPQGDRLDAGRDLSLAGVEFFRLFPDADAFTVRTAARMSATFPVVSPAVPLPVTPTRRVVDAGYFDNYGIDALANWLLAHRQEVIDNTSGVLLIQVRAYPLETGGLKFESDSQSPVDLIIGAVSAPLQAVFTARSSAAYHRNNELLGEVDRAFRGAAKGRPFFTTVTFEQQREAALSWYLTTPQKKQVVEGFYQKLEDGTWPREGAKPQDNVKQKLDAIREWFGKP